MINPIQKSRMQVDFVVKIFVVKILKDMRFDI